jgi:serine/threonine protein kinase
MDVPYSELKFEERIYTDNYVDVYKGDWRKQQVAITMIKTNPDQSEIVDQIVSQINIHRTIKHPNIVDFHCFVSEEPRYCLVTSYFHPVTISDSIHVEKIKLTFKQVRKISLDICRATKYLHLNNILHRVLCTSKILLKGDHIKFSDYFLRISPYLKDSKNILEIFKEPYFIAPEALEGNKFTEKSDVYSLGSIFWELYSNEKISKLNLKDNKSIANEVINGKRPCSTSKLDELIKNASDKEVAFYLDLIKQCWKQDPNERPSMDYIIDTLRGVFYLLDSHH